MSLFFFFLEHILRSFFLHTKCHGGRKQLLVLVQKLVLCRAKAALAKSFIKKTFPEIEANIFLYLPGPGLCHNGNTNH